MKYKRQDQLIKILLKYFKGIAPLAIYDMVETLWPENNTDEKVKFDIGDPVAGYLWDKVLAGPGIILTEGEDTDANKLVISAPGGGVPLNIVAGPGMDFPTNSPVTLGTPSTVDKTTTNSVTTHSHTHELGHVYEWNIHSPEQIIGYLDEPDNIVAMPDGTGAIDETIPEGAIAITAINTAGETLATDCPTFDILVDSTEAVISWDAVIGATGYRIYYGGSYLETVLLSVDFLDFVPDTLADLPLENTAAIFQSPFTIDNEDTVQVVGEGIDIETEVDELDATKKILRLKKQQSSWLETDEDSPNYIPGKPTIPTGSLFPDTITSETANSETETTHTHELGKVNLDSVVKGKPVEYGALYNWWAVTDSRKITSSDDWDVASFNWSDGVYDLLKTNFGGYATGGGVAKETGIEHWQTPNTGATNDYGFNARGGGFRHSADGVFVNLKSQGFYWSKTEANSTTAYSVIFNYNNTVFDATNMGKSVGASVNLVKISTLLSEGERGIYTGNNGKQFETICINGQEWVINLNETKYRSGDWITGFDGGVYTPIADLDWAALTTEAMCYYDDNEANGGGETPLSTLLHPPVTIHPDSASRASIDGNQVLTIEAQVGGQPYQVLTAKDIEAGTAQTYDLIIKCRQDITIESIVVECDDGTLTGCTVTIGATAITFSSGTFSVSTTLTEIAATADNVASAGDRVKINTTTGFTGTPTVLNVQLNYTVN